MKTQTLQFYYSTLTGQVESATYFGIIGRNRNKVMKENKLKYVGSLQCNQNPFFVENENGELKVYRNLYGKNELQINETEYINK